MTTLGQLDARLDQLARRVDAAESLLALHELKSRYAALVDARFERGTVVDRVRLDALAASAASLATVRMVPSRGSSIEA